MPEAWINFREGQRAGHVYTVEPRVGARAELLAGSVTTDEYYKGILRKDGKILGMAVDLIIDEITGSVVGAEVTEVDTSIERTGVTKIVPLVVESVIDPSSQITVNSDEETGFIDSRTEKRVFRVG